MKLKYVAKIADRHGGAPFYYFRYRGKLARLHGEFGSPAGQVSIASIRLKVMCREIAWDELGRVLINRHCPGNRWLRGERRMHSTALVWV
jgi:hypothetical protein